MGREIIRYSGDELVVSFGFAGHHLYVVLACACAVSDNLVELSVKPMAFCARYLLEEGDDVEAVRSALELLFRPWARGGAVDIVVRPSPEFEESEA